MVEKRIKKYKKKRCFRNNNAFFRPSDSLEVRFFVLFFPPTDVISPNSRDRTMKSRRYRLLCTFTSENIDSRRFRIASVYGVRLFAQLYSSRYLNISYVYICFRRSTRYCIRGDGHCVRQRLRLTRRYYCVISETTLNIITALRTNGF